MAQRTRERNWALVVVASIVIVVNLALCFCAFLLLATWGWASVVVLVGGLAAITLAILAIRKNDPSWLLLDLIMPT